MIEGYSSNRPCYKSTTLPFLSKGDQFPLLPAFFKTSGKLQGQVLHETGVILSQSMFSSSKTIVEEVPECVAI
jgi:hypothetical protein